MSFYVEACDYRGTRSWLAFESLAVAQLCVRYEGIPLWRDPFAEDAGMACPRCMAPQQEDHSDVIQTIASGTYQCDYGTGYWWELAYCCSRCGEVYISGDST